MAFALLTLTAVCRTNIDIIWTKAFDLATLVKEKKWKKLLHRKQSHIFLIDRQQGFGARRNRDSLGVTQVLLHQIKLLSV